MYLLNIFAILPNVIPIFHDIIIEYLEHRVPETVGLGPLYNDVPLGDVN